jgi:hypothetical protein
MGTRSSKSKEENCRNAFSNHSYPMKPDRIQKNTGVQLYSPFTSSSKWVCFDCRLCFHKWNGIGGNCSTCKKPMSYAGTAFRAPARRNVKEWKRLEALIRSGVRFNYCGTHWPNSTLKNDIGKINYAVRGPGDGKRRETKAWFEESYRLPQ